MRLSGSLSPETTSNSFDESPILRGSSITANEISQFMKVVQALNYRNNKDMPEIISGIFTYEGCKGKFNFSYMGDDC